jgi:Zn-dependent protease
MLLELIEIRDIVLMTLVIGFIFKDVFPRRTRVEVLTPEYYLGKSKHKKTIVWNDFWFAAAVVAPSIILHEFGHKFVAIANGMTASFHAAYFWLGIGVLLKIIGVGFIFFVPAYTSIIGSGTDMQFASIAFAGPAVNLVMWLGSLVILKANKNLKRDTHQFLSLLSKINMFLFIFNMLPIPGFDGAQVFSALSKAFF